MNRQHEFEENLKTSRKALLSFISTKCSKHLDPEDVLQRASVIMWKKYDSFDPKTNFISWAFAISAFEVSNCNRVFNRCPVSFDSEVFDVVSLKQKTVEHQDNDDYDNLNKALSILDQESKDLLIDVYINLKEIKDLAKKAGKSPQTYYNKLNLIKKKLADHLNG